MAGWHFEPEKGVFFYFYLILFRNFTKMFCQRRTSFKLLEMLSPYSKKCSVSLQGRVIKPTMLKLSVHFT